MPIKGITKFYRPQRQGIIHLGVKVKTEKRCPCKDKGADKKPNPECLFCLGTGFIHRPKEVDYFVLKDAPELVKFYEEQSRSLNVMLPSSRFEKSFDEYLEKVFPQYLKRYKSAGLICKGDGETATCVNEETGALEEQECPCDYLEKGDCSRIGILRVRIQEIPTFNVYQITTSSFNSMVNVNSFVRDLAEYCAVNRIDISSVKLMLRRGEQTVQRREGGKLSKSKHWIMTMDLDPRFYKALSDVALVALPQAQAKPKALPPPDEGIDDLFFPAEIVDALNKGAAIIDETKKKASRLGINLGEGQIEEGEETDRRLGANDQDIASPDVKKAESFGKEIGSTFAKEKKGKETDEKSPEYVARRQVLAEKLMSLTAEYRLLGGKVNVKTWDRIMGFMKIEEYELAIKHYEDEIKKLKSGEKKAPAPKGKQGSLA